MKVPPGRARPHASPNLHGNAPDKSGVALLFVDVINDLEFAGGEKLLRPALTAATRLAALRVRAQTAGVPCIYANDNFGRWRSDFRAQFEHVRDEGTRGAPIAALLAPGDDDYFVLKARHSAFYETSLRLLLEHLGVSELVIGGFATESCVSLTANDAYLRGFGVHVLSDGCASQTRAVHLAALKQMARVLHASTADSTRLSFVRGKGGTSLRVRARK